MKILWNSEKPLLVSDILSLAINVAENSLHPIIKNLIKKDYIKVVGTLKISKTQSRFYAPAITIDEYAAQQINEIFNDTGKNANISNILSYLVKHNKKKDSKNIISEMEQFIKLYKERNEN